MSTSTEEIRWTGRNWQIVRTDPDLRHVEKPLQSFSFQLTERHGVPGYKIVSSSQDPLPLGLEASFLVPAGFYLPTFREVTRKDDLPLYSDDKATVTEYENISELISTYVEQNRDVRRLEGVFKIPCHPYDARRRDGSKPEHQPVWIKTPLHVYQLGNVVKGNPGLTLLLLRSPLSPLCPMNGDGTAAGYGHP